MTPREKVVLASSPGREPRQEHLAHSRCAHDVLSDKEAVWSFQHKLTSLTAVEKRVAAIDSSSSPQQVRSLASEARALHDYFQKPEARALYENSLLDAGDARYFSHYKFDGLKSFYVKVDSLSDTELARGIKEGEIIGGVILSPEEKAVVDRGLKTFARMETIVRRLRTSEPTLQDAEELLTLSKDFHEAFKPGMDSRRLLEAMYRKMGDPNPERRAHDMLAVMTELYGKSTAKEVLVLLNSPEFRGRLEAAITDLAGAVCALHALFAALQKVARPARTALPALSSSESSKVIVARDRGADATLSPSTGPINTFEHKGSSDVEFVKEALTLFAAAARREKMAQIKAGEETQQKAIKADARRIQEVLVSLADRFPQLGIALMPFDFKYMSLADVEAILALLRNFEQSVSTGGTGPGIPIARKAPPD